MVRVAINGFGRIGRSCFRAGMKNKNIEFVALNDLFDTKTSAHMLKYDTFHGILDAEVKAKHDAIVVDEREIKCFAERNPENLPWEKLDIDVVVESTGLFRSKEDAEKHLNAGAKKVIISAPPSGKTPVKTIVLGVNEDTFNPEEDFVITNASCTTNCLAPIAKLMNNEFGIVKGFMTTVHAYTNDQQILDVAHLDLRRARSAAANIIPTSTGAAKALGDVIPDLKGKLDGMAFRVPVPLGSVTDLVAELKKETTIEEINSLLKKAAESEKLKRIIDYTSDPIVSSDIIGNTHSVIVDALSTMVIQKDFVKLVLWYDNETGYSHRLVDLVEFISE